MIFKDRKPQLFICNKKSHLPTRSHTKKMFPWDCLSLRIMMICFAFLAIVSFATPCSICDERIVSPCCVARPKCMHTFHARCLRKHVRRNNCFACPTCDEPIPKLSLERAYLQKHEFHFFASLKNQKCFQSLKCQWWKIECQIFVPQRFKLL